MFSITIQPRFGDMDILGHINNVVPVTWFELGRNPMFKIFDPELRFETGTFPLIMAHSEYDYILPMHFKYQVEIRTWISRIGTKSFTVYQEAWQEGQLGVKGSTVVVYYDYQTKTSAPVPEEVRKQLAEHLLPDG